MNNQTNLKEADEERKKTENEESKQEVNHNDENEINHPGLKTYILSFPDLIQDNCKSKCK